MEDRIPAVRAGELRRIEAEEVKARAEAARKAAAAKRKAEERACETLEDFIKLGKARNNKPGWAHVQWKLRTQREAPIRPFPFIDMTTGWPI